MPSINAKKLIRNLLEGSKATTGYYGLADLAANTDGIVSEIYAGEAYTDAERASIAAWLASKPIRVFPEYPRDVADLPAVFVWRVSDGEASPGVLGDYLGDDDDDDNDLFAESARYGTWFNEQISVNMWAYGDGAMRDDLYLAVREIIIRGRQYLHAAGLITCEWKSGQDGQMYRPEYLPHVIHTAEASIHCEALLHYVSKHPATRQIKTNYRGYAGGTVSARPFEDE
jgi:hypothetical protein